MIFHPDVEHNWPPFREQRSRDPQFRLIRAGVFPSASPSGDRIVCNSKPGASHHNGILSMRTDGAGRSVLFRDAEKSAVAPVWSPQGDKIAFGLGQFFQMALGPAIADIAVVGSDGTGFKVLTDGSGNCGFPSWSPDGRRIVYRSSAGKTNAFWIMNVETGEAQALERLCRSSFRLMASASL